MCYNLITKSTHTIKRPKMNFYLYNVTIFDTAPDADLSVFPKIEPHAAIAENETEAQRQIVDKLYDLAENGTCAKYATREDAVNRFNIVFGEPEQVRPVEWAEEINDWIWTDEDRDLQIGIANKGA